MVEQLVDLICAAQNDQAQLTRVVAMTKALERHDHETLVRQLTQIASHLASAQVATEVALRELAKPDALTDECRAAIPELYLAVPPENNIRNNLLFWLGTDGSQDSIQLWSELITSQPPANPHGLVQAFSPLFEKTDISQDVFDLLATQGISHPEIAAAALDLMNYHTRQGNIDEHPAIDRAPQLSSLLGNVVQQMARVEEGNVPPGLTPQELSQRISESVALTISLCDSVALMEYEPAVGKLNQAIQLKHRRIQTEAAAALARLDIDEGRTTLCKLAEEPIARLRVLAFAEELGFLDQIPEEQQNEVAVAESQLVSWLAEPAQMGIAPSEIELADNREMYWPSYDHPVHCYLFRFTYGTNPTYTNIGIAGPVTHAFPVNVEYLTIDDTYAAFAGWHAVHQEIYQLTLEQASGIHASDLTSLLAKLNQQDFDNSQPDFVGSFFGELVLTANADRNDESVVVLVDASEVYCFTCDSEDNRIDTKMAYTIWRGRKLLEQFNT